METLPQNRTSQNAANIALGFADDMVGKNYLQRLAQGEIAPPTMEDKDISPEQNIRFWRLSRLVVNKKEHFSEQLTTLLHAANAAGGSVVTILTSKRGTLEVFLGVVSKENRGPGASSRLRTKATLDTFADALAGNLAGSELTRLPDEAVAALQARLAENRAVCAISGIPAFRDKEQHEILRYAQGIEHLADALQGKDFTLISIADPVAPQKIEQMKQGYELVYSQLSSLLKTQIVWNESSAVTLSDAQTRSMTDSISKGISLMQSKTKTDGRHTAFSAGMGGGINFGIAAFANVGISTGKNSALSESRGETKSWNEGTASTSGHTKSIANAASSGKSIQCSYENRAVQSLLTKIDSQLHRLDLCESFGAFESAVYILSADQSVSVSAAGNFNALLRAEGSCLESSAINTWYEPQDVQPVTEYLRYFTHPKFQLDKQYRDFSVGTLTLSPASLMTGREATLLLGLPRQSVSGVSVLEMTPFGRNFPAADKASGIRLGKLHHMSKDEGKDVVLDMASLTAHTLVTGSTGSGKSNTVYHMLRALREKNVPFLIVEPAKGEYKQMFGHDANVAVFGTNPDKTPLLRIHPFKFPADIHVLEHIDRLIEIFNVCWPMYAAMPAVLKEAVEAAYTASGWDLNRSVNRYSIPLYPNFMDVLEQLHKVVNRSEFSQELKSNYIGALATRVKSLTNGINGQIFVCDEIGDTTLFDQNCIVDLSRVASMETKALLMGILVMRLQEYRLSVGGMNRDLRHVTVLEEAHHLLKRTSTEQIGESANLLGKSVEMLSNAIAEMRTYGEGFVIVDQSPSMLDLSVIRNTNTKVLLRLPAFADRELSGRAAGLGDEQIAELAKLPTGVAAVYQNNWLDPVLCHMEPYSGNAIPYVYTPECETDTLKQDVIRCLLGTAANETVELDLDRLERRVVHAPLSIATKLHILDAMHANHRIDLIKSAPAIAGLFAVEETLKTLPEMKNIEQWNNLLLDRMAFPRHEMSQKYQDLVLFCIVSQAYERKDAERLDHWLQSMEGRLF